MEYEGGLESTEGDGDMDMENLSDEETVDGNDNKNEGESQDMFDSQDQSPLSSQLQSFGLWLPPSGKENSTMSNITEDGRSQDIQGRLKNDLQIKNGIDDDSSDDEKEEIKPADEPEEESSDDEEEKQMYRMNRMPIKEEVIECSSLSSNIPSAVKISEGGFSKHKGVKAGKDEEQLEGGVDMLMERVKKRKAEKETVIAEIKKVDRQIETSKENQRMRTNRMEVLSSKTTKIEAELFRSTETSKVNKKEEKKLLDTKKINEKMNDAKKLVKTMEENTIRLMLGKKQGEVTEEATLGRIQESEKNLTIFFPGTVESQPSIIKEELGKVDNLKIIMCQDDGIKKMVGAIKKYELTKEKKGDVGMFILKIGKVMGTVDEGIIKTNVNKMMTQLQLVINRGLEKFEEQIFVLPPANLENWKATRILGEQMKEYKSGLKIIDILEEQMGKGLEKKDETEAVWTVENLVLDKKYDNEEGASGGLNEYSFRRCIDRAARLLDGKAEDNSPWCEVCGFTHPSGNCLLDTASK